MKNYIYSERIELFEPNVYIKYLVQVTGNPTVEALVLAVKAAFAANEATLSKVVLEKNGDAYYEQMVESGCKVSVSKNDWKDILRQNEKVPFSLAQGELMRVFVITSGTDVYLFIMAHHLVGDGKAVTYFIEDVMTALSGEGLVYKPLLLITKEAIPVQSKLPFLLRQSITILNKKWKRTGQVFEWKDYDAIHKAYWEEHSSEIVYESFSLEEINRIHTYAKEIGISVNSYILAAFSEANRDNSTIGMAVSIRPGNNKSISNQVSGISVDYTYTDKVPFAENAQRIHQKVINKLAKPAMKYFIPLVMPLFSPSLVDSVLLYTCGLYKNKTTQTLAGAMGYTGKDKKELGITNLTKLDIPVTYGTYGLQNGLFIAPVVSYSKRIVGVSTMADGMTISYAFMNELDKEKELKFFQRAIQNIKNRCAAPNKNGFGHLEDAL